MILMDQRAEQLGRMRTDMPLLLLSGDRDPVGENERGVRKVYKRFSDAGCRDITLAFIRTPAMSCSMRPTGRRYGRIFFPGFWGIWRNRIVKTGPGAVAAPG